MDGYFTLRLASDLGCEFQHKLLQQALLTVLEDGDLGEGGQVNADRNLCLQLNGQLLEDLVLPRDLLVDVEVLVPVADSLPQVFADVPAAQVDLHLEQRRMRRRIAK